MMTDAFDQYKKNLREWSKAIAQNRSSKISNKLLENIEKAAKHLIDNKKETEILSLINDNDPGVRFIAAGHVERYGISPGVAKYVLNGIIKDPNAASALRIMASTTIRFSGILSPKLTENNMDNTAIINQKR